MQAGPPWYPGTPATSSNRSVTSELPDIYREAGAAGVFVFKFAEPCKPHLAVKRAQGLEGQRFSGWRSD